MDKQPEKPNNTPVPPKVEKPPAPKPERPDIVRYAKGDWKPDRDKKG